MNDLYFKKPCSQACTPAFVVVKMVTVFTYTQNKIFGGMMISHAEQDTFFFY